ncbi:lipopolysaccharide assembly protein LapB [Tenacibaculum sp. SG-28]|uniref:tetratricopeptide repeat protein n=1 Tax=Tenacibaculum sp. SG-28 TaxID=754426 RepID=UPI000CF4AD05|nr:tetratricopeptide repeat protein [Tenacibaculum sp. SG-28]PQJ23198.1 hypothetical protein BSU00_02930 [Tenacibaculum sp. SG-28]
MKRYYTIFFLAAFLFSCSRSVNSREFITKATGRYYFNSDETIQVYFKNEKLLINWRNKELIPTRINDSTFYVKEMNEKLVFDTINNKITLAKKREHKELTYVFEKLKEGEKTPREYLNENNYEMALAGYLKIQNKDSLDKTISSSTLRKLTRSFTRNKKYTKAINTAKINSILHPKQSMPFYFLGNAYLKNKDTINAKIAFKKALEINPENYRAQDNLETLAVTHTDN